MSKWPETKRARAILEALYPQLFSLENPVPLKVGIYTDLAETFPEMPPAVLKNILAWITDRRAYLNACTVGAFRYGLNGRDGVVSEKEAAYARWKFADRDSKAKNKWANRFSEAA